MLPFDSSMIKARLSILRFGNAAADARTTFCCLRTFSGDSSRRSVSASVSLLSDSSLKGDSTWISWFLPMPISLRLLDRLTSIPMLCFASAIPSGLKETAVLAGSWAGSARGASGLEIDMPSTRPT